MWEHVRTAENTNKRVHRGTSKLVAEDWQNNAGPHWQTSEIWTSKHLRALFFSSVLICSIRFCYCPYTSIYCLALTTVCQYYPSGIRHDHGLQDGNPFPAREFKWPGPILSNHEVACKLNCRKTQLKCLNSLQKTSVVSTFDIFVWKNVWFSTFLHHRLAKPSDHSCNRTRQ